MKRKTKFMTPEDGLAYYSKLYPNIAFKYDSKFDIIIGNNGQCFSRNPDKGRIGTQMPSGYWYCKGAYIAELLLKHFAIYDPTLDITYIDSDPSNLSLSNIIQMPHGSAIRKTVTARYGHHPCVENCGKNNVRSRAVLQYDKDKNLINEWPSENIAATELGFKAAGINRCVNGILKTYKGFIWERK